MRRDDARLSSRRFRANFDDARDGRREARPPPAGQRARRRVTRDAPANACPSVRPVAGRRQIRNAPGPNRPPCRHAGWRGSRRAVDRAVGPVGLHDRRARAKSPRRVGGGCRRAFAARGASRRNVTIELWQVDGNGFRQPVPDTDETIATAPAMGPRRGKTGGIERCRLGQTRFPAGPRRRAYSIGTGSTLPRMPRKANPGCTPAQSRGCRSIAWRGWPPNMRRASASRPIQHGGTGCLRPESWNGSRFARRSCCRRGRCSHAIARSWRLTQPRPQRRDRRGAPGTRCPGP